MSEEQPSPEPVEGRMVGMVGMDGRPAGIRTFGMNSREFYEAVTERPGPWRWGPGIPSIPDEWRPPVVPGVVWRDG